jgi:hypothetical protein
LDKPWVVHERVELPRDHPPVRARGDLFMEAFLFQEIVERRSDPCFLLRHAICFLRFDASSRSPSGAAMAAFLLVAEHDGPAIFARRYIPTRAPERHYTARRESGEVEP